jgi:lipoprotein-releasing system permease protein
MNLPFELAIALRHVRSRNQNRFVSFISLISMVGIAIAVMVLIVVLSVMNGFESEVQDRILRVVAHGSITGLDNRLPEWQNLARIADGNPEVRAVAPYVEGQAMLVGAAAVRGVQLRGIDPVAQQQAAGLEGLMRAGSLDSLRSRGYGIVIGARLAEELELTLGSRIVVLVAEGAATPAGFVPRTRRFVVTGIFNAGMYEFDRSLAFMHLDDARRLLRFGDGVSGLQLAMNDVLRAPAVVRDVAVAYGGGVSISDWTRQHANFFRSIQLTRSIVFMILLLVVAVAAFNIVSTLVMVVRDKRAEIAILRTLGAAPSSVLALFMGQGIIIGVLGTVIGVLAGVLLAWNISPIAAGIESLLGFRFLAADVYFISELPSRLLWSDVLRIASIALGLSLISTLYPAWRAAVTAPAEVLRHE